jgi:hypothetical protein
MRLNAPQNQPGHYGEQILPPLGIDHPDHSLISVPTEVITEFIWQLYGFKYLEAGSLEATVYLDSRYLLW